VTREAAGGTGTGSGRPAAARAAVVGLGFVVLLAVVALASGARGRGTSGAAARELPLGIFDYVYTLGILVLVAAVLSVLFLRKPGRARGGSLTGFLRTTLFLAVVTALAVYALQRGLSPEALEDLRSRLSREGALPGGLSDPQSPTARPAEFRWELAVALVAGIACLAVLSRLRPRRRPGSRQERRDVAEELAAALEITLDDLRAERDARRAVIAAYARMERILGAHGVARRPSEAPLEYLARVLRGLAVGAGSTLDLAALFERAKFSPHAVDAEMKDDAIAALASVRDDLRAAA
jgi:hypothetical protein